MPTSAVITFPRGGMKHEIVSATSRPAGPWTSRWSRCRERPAQYKADEAERLLAAIPPGATVLALDERGRQWDSRGFAGYVAALRDRATPCLALVIGGPDGLDPAVRERADRVWALGQLTMSHELARLVLAEQLYRAATIMTGLPYHRD